MATWTSEKKPLPNSGPSAKEEAGKGPLEANPQDGDEAQKLRNNFGTLDQRAGHWGQELLWPENQVG